MFKAPRHANGGNDIEHESVVDVTTMGYRNEYLAHGGMGDEHSRRDATKPYRPMEKPMGQRLDKAGSGKDDSHGSEIP